MINLFNYITNMFKRKDMVKHIFEDILKIKDEYKDVVEIDYTKIHAGNFVYYLRKFTKADLVTYYDDKVYVVKDNTTYIIDISKEPFMIVDEIKNTIGVITECDEKAFFSADETNTSIVNTDYAKVEGIEYYAITFDNNSVGVFTSLSCKTDVYDLNNEFKEIFAAYFVTNKNKDMELVIKGIDKKDPRKRKLQYYTVDKFQKIRTRYIDEFGNMIVEMS